MGIRKNAKFLDATERENFVKACVLMKADIVNPGAPVASRYSRWDEAAAIHRMIQNVNSPAGNGINFGHGGSGAFSFLSWHRFFLQWFEQQLRAYVPGTGLMLPYWDWSDPAPLMTDGFLGPDGAVGSNLVASGYFAPNAPGTAGNPTAAPAWWPAGLAGWNFPAAFGTLAGGLTRNLSAASGLPSVADLQATLSRSTYSSFQNTLESGAGLASGQQMHNGLHGWVSGHMGSLTGSPFDPLFYLHHCNIDRLWAMWQMDGHASTYPAAGANNQHGPNDLMYPWTGGAAGYSSNLSFGSIVMPDFAALGAQRNVDTLDHRAMGYSYDTLAVIGIGLDRTGSMNGLTPDPITGSGNVSKWTAAKRGVSAFLQDCETVQASAAIYVNAGVKTFRSTGGGNDFAAVFAGTPYGLVKNGSAYSKGAFDGAVAPMTAAGGTPLADALIDVQASLVEPPFGNLPAGEQRYLAMLTDGMLTSGAPLASIGAGAFANTVIFAMGFGTPADVDYPTLNSLVTKGKTLAIPQVFHGENAGVIDKFYSNALAQAIGFSTVFDPVLELFAGEHTHLAFSATSADDSFFITAQGMDFEDPNWSYQLIGPDGHPAYSEGMPHGHGLAGSHAARQPHVTLKRGAGRLSLMLQRDSADAGAWIGAWTLMIGYRAKDMSGMLMTDLGELMVPVAAGPVRGARYARLLQPLEKRLAARSVPAKARHALDVRPGSTNRDGAPACAVVVNVYARTRLRLELVSKTDQVALDGEWAVSVHANLLAGQIVNAKGFARLIAPRHDLAALVAQIKPADIPNEAWQKGVEPRRFDAAVVLAMLEKKSPKLALLRDEEVKLVSHHDGPLHLHVDKLGVPGLHHLGVYVEGVYRPEAPGAAAGGAAGGEHPHGGVGAGAGASAAMCCGAEGRDQRFTRLLNLSIPVLKA